MVNNELRSVAKRGGLNDICEWREGVIRDGYDVQSREIYVRRVDRVKWDGVARDMRGVELVQHR